VAKRSANQDGINKSAAIREILARDPHTPVRDIVSTLGERGISVHPNLVYLIKSKAKAKRGKAKREKALANSRAMGVANPVELILAVRKLAVQAGGLRHLKQLVDVLAE
jgi:hypothetical protein